MPQFKISIVAALSAALACAPSAAADWDVTAQVVSIEATYMPNSLRLQIDRAAGTCATGATLFWTPQGATYAEQTSNAQAVLKLMTNAQASGSGIRLVGINAGCSVQLVYSAPAPGSPPAGDWNVTGAHVTWLTGINAPTAIAFKLDKGVSACPAGTFLSFTPTGSTDAQRVANSDSQLAMLLTARAAGLTMQVYGSNTGCTVSSIISQDGP